MVKTKECWADMDMKKVLIIGGAGFIGSNLCRHLVEHRYNVFCFDMISPKSIIPEVNYITGDFFDEDTLEHVIDGMDFIIHALSTINPGNSNNKYMQGYERDFIQTIKLCKMIIGKEIRMIFLSSGGTVYGNCQVQPIDEEVLPVPINHYGNVKLCIENAIRTFNYQAYTKMLIARISNPYGVGQDFNKGVGFIDAVLKRTIMNKEIEIWGDGENIRDYIYIDDVCKMLIKLLEYKGKHDTFNISSGIGVSQNEIVQIVRGLGAEPKVVYKEYRSVDTRRIILNNFRIRTIYHQPLVELETGIRMYYQYLVNGGING